MSKNYALQNQIYLYSLETSDFYTDEEKFISDKYFKALRIRKRIKKKKESLVEVKNFYIEEMEVRTLTDDENKLKDKYLQRLNVYAHRQKRINSFVESLKEELNNKLIEYDGIRTLRTDALKDNKIISLFESTLTRVCGMQTDQTTKDLFVIRVFHYQVLKNILENGFLYENQKYKYYTSSAGQIRTKKIVCINENLYSKYENTLTCGLTPEIINAKGGVNTNKYQAYLALGNSASMKWYNFGIDRVIVVDDFSTNVHGVVDYIDRDTYEIERKEMDMPIDHMDGCGIMLPSVSKKSCMFRMPWVKGLLTPFDFKKFALQHGNTKITDIYGKEYDIIDDRINIILTKSQFKMWKYYDSWNDYKSKFKKYKCEASKLNIEDIGADANLNYQMLQTLTTMTDDELIKLADKTNTDIVNIGSDKKTMLRVLGATKENSRKNYFQKSLLLYPELLSDSHSKQVIKDKKKSLVNDARAGKLRINGKYTFIIPDLYAFCEWLFLGIDVPKGLLNNNEVYCNIFEEGKVDVLRSPHLYKEHAVRNNIKNQQLEEWFITKGIYTSTYDLISRILQFDVDGDKSLVVQDEILISVAEREMKDIVPLYYEMAKAEATQITPQRMFTALTSAYKANIGIISNDITKIWNSPNPSLNAVKWLTMYNNFVIDFAKTLFLPLPPKEAEEEIKSFTKHKVPNFFRYAKDKEKSQVEKVNKSTVNRLEKLIKNKRIKFENISGEFDYKKLLHSQDVIEINEDVINTYKNINYNKFKWMTEANANSEERFNSYLRSQLHSIINDDVYLTDMLIVYNYTQNTRFKNTLWNVYGDIIYENLKSNLDGTIQCELCNERIRVTQDNEKYCEKCKKEKITESWRLSKQRKRMSKKLKR